MLNRRFRGALQRRVLRHVAVLARAAIVTTGIAMASTAGARDLKAEAAQQVVVQLRI